MQITGNSYDNGMVCAHCNHENTHLHSVETFSRVEDAKTGMHVIADIIDGIGLVSSDTNLSRNPSGRRDAVIVYFECEDDACGRLTELHIIQHKGIDYLSLHRCPRPGRMPVNAIDD